jgi:hypothetical protein
MGRITITKDEADRRQHDPLKMYGIAPGMSGRWVRTGGHDPDGRQQTVREKGYVPVTREAWEKDGGYFDPRLRTGEGAQQDTTIKRGDLMLMQAPTKDIEARREANAQFAKRREGAVLAKFKAQGGYDEK